MFLNVIHRADPCVRLLEALKFQQEQAHRFGLKLPFKFNIQL